MKNWALILAVASIGLASCSTQKEQPADDTAMESATPEPVGEDVQPQDATLENSDILPEGTDISELGLKTKKESCFWNGKQYSDGGVVCESSRSYKCWDGRWVAGNFCK